MSLNIWYISKYLTLPQDRVGGRSFLLLREFVRLGHKAFAFTSNSNHLVQAPEFEGNRLERTVDGVHLCWTKTLGYDRAKSVRRILSWLSFEWALLRNWRHDYPRPDVVIVSSLSLLSIINGLILKRKYRCPLIFEVRDIWPLTIVEEGGFSARNPAVLFLAAIERLAYQKSDVIVGTMPNLGEHVRNVAGDRAAPVCCIPMGIDETVLNHSDPIPAAYVRDNIPLGKFVVCHAGTIGITNALDTFIACARRMQQRTDTHFLVVGDGDLKESYREQCADLDNITFAPSVPKRQVQSVLSYCDLLYFSVHASRVWRFGQSLNKVIDYMLAGKPIVASYTGYPSMIDEAGSGTFVPAGDVVALERAIANYSVMPVAEREEIGRRGREWLLKHRNYAKLAKDYIAIIDEVLESGAGKREPKSTGRS